MSRGELAVTMRRALSAFDPAALERFEVQFGGGSRIALAHDEFRVSTDLDFVCSSASGYADLRRAIRDRGYEALVRPGTIELPREPRMDAYGIRFPIVVDGRTIRLEIIREARIVLGAPEHPSWTTAPCVSIADCFAEKLLANSDRGADRDVLARDLIDLAVLRETHGPIPERAWRAAESAYKEAPREDLIKAIEGFRRDERFRERCFEGLQIEDRDRVLRGVELLAGDLGVQG